MFNKQQLFFFSFVVYLLSVTYSFAAMRTWADGYGSGNSSDIYTNNNIYIGIRGYISSLSVNSIKNNLSDVQLRKNFYRVYCTGAQPTDKWLCGEVLETAPTSAGNGYESVTAVIDLSGEKFSTQNMSYQLPSFSVIFGKSLLTDGLHVELEAGASSSSSSSGSFFSKNAVVDISALKGGVNLGATAPGASLPLPELAGLDKYKVSISSMFDAELSRSFLGFNLIYDVDIGEVKPFIGVGASYTMYTTMLNIIGNPEINKGIFGEAFTDGKVFNTQEYKFNRITYSFLAGFSYPVSDTVTAELGYKHTFGGDIDWSLVKKDDKSSIKLPVMTIKNIVFKEMFLGLRYNF